MNCHQTFILFDDFHYFFEHLIFPKNPLIKNYVFFKFWLRITFLTLEYCQIGGSTFKEQSINSSSCFSMGFPELLVISHVFLLILTNIFDYSISTFSRDHPYTMSFNVSFFLVFPISPVFLVSPSPSPYSFLLCLC